MKKKCSAALKKRSGDITTKIFEQCVRDVLGMHKDSIEDLYIAIDLVRSSTLRGFFGAIEDEEVKEMAEAKIKVDDLYQERIRELSTKDLNDLLKSHELEGGIRRTGRTLETILNELARRSLFDDSSESDLNTNNGVVDGLKSKSGTSSKKTTKKRSKTSKNKQGK
jgi:hypothetical protein